MPHSRLRRLPTVKIPGLCEHAHVASDPLARLLGLARLDSLPDGHGLLITRCHSIHTFGMRFPLDLYFLAPDLRVVETRRGVGPARFASCPAAAAVLELPATPPRRPDRRG